MYKQVNDIKRETRKDFPDFTEKAVTGALGRCLAQCGFGTAYALQDLDEGNRIVDAPLEARKKDSPVEPATKQTTGPLVTKTSEVVLESKPDYTNHTEAPAPAKSSFRKKAEPPKQEEKAPEATDGWE